MTFKIYTKTGDQGETGLFGGERVAKDHGRVETYGTIDELNAFLGAALGRDAPQQMCDELIRIQGELFQLGAQLATPATKSGGAGSPGVGPEHVSKLEQAIDRFEAELAPLKTFILPGGSPLAGQLHVARAVCRRAERACVTLRRNDPTVEQITVTYLNRLSDLLFVLARAANAHVGVPDTPWTAPKGAA